MDVSLRADLEQFLKNCVQQGRFRSANEAMNEAVQLLKDAEEAENRLEQLLQQAEESGPATDIIPQDWIDIENEGLKRLRSRKSA